MSTLSKKVIDGLKAKGWAGGIVPIGRIHELERDVVSLLDQGLIDNAVHEAYLMDFKYQAPEQLPDARSIIVVAVPQPRMRIHFAYDGKDVAAIVPPTYANAWTVINGVKAKIGRAHV
jgi:epoxyqueuosine reductase